MTHNHSVVDIQMSEEWKKVSEFEDYEVSNLGRVRRGQKVLKPNTVLGYYQVSLCKDGVRRNKRVHRLVCQAFLPNPDDKPTVNHIDHNGLNNTLENLEWATSSEQGLHSPPPIGKSEQRNINLNSFGSYRVKIKRTNKIIFDKTFPTLQEAVEARDKFLSPTE